MAAQDRYKVVRLYFKSTKRTLIAQGLTEKQAKAKAASFKDSKTSMVVFYKM